MQTYRGINYYLCGSYYQNKGVRLHRLVWESFYGAIPQGHHVHHIDGDRSNNCLENLQCLPAGKHISRHLTGGHGKETVKIAQKAAAAWHRSPAGKQFHREHYRKNCKDILEKKITMTCEHCAAEYETVDHGNNRFCSNNCKSAARRASGIDNEERICRVCFISFTINKYQKTQTCSRICSRRI